MADLDLKLAERTVDMIKAEGGHAAAHAGDMTKEAECKRLVDAAVDRWGRLDFLDNNIGIGSRGSVVDEKPDEYRRVMQINVETMFLLSKHAIPAMIKTAKGGSIVNISSISALRPRGLTTYTTSKAAVIGLTQAMAVDHGKDHIRVNCICPGPMYTPMVYARGNGMSEAARAAARQGLGAEDRRHRLGHRPRRALPAEQPCPLHHRPGAGGRRRRHAAGPGATRFSRDRSAEGGRHIRWPACPISSPTRSRPNIATC